MNPELRARSILRISAIVLVLFSITGTMRGFAVMEMEICVLSAIALAILSLG